MNKRLRGENNNDNNNDNDYYLRPAGVSETGYLL
jgi:hypothetical protein